VLIRLEENGMKLIEFPSVCVAVYRGMRWASRRETGERAQRKNRLYTCLYIKYLVDSNNCFQKQKKRNKTSTTTIRIYKRLVGERVVQLFHLFFHCGKYLEKIKKKEKQKPPRKFLASNLLGKKEGEWKEEEEEEEIVWLISP
jgi:hypothetical protein